MAGKEAADRKQKLIKTLMQVGIFLMIIVLWVVLYGVIQGTSATRKPKGNEMVVTDPINVIGLTAPITVTFDVGEALGQSIEPQYIRQIQWDFEGDGTWDASGPVVTHRFIDRGKNNGRFPVIVDIHYLSPKTGAQETLRTQREVIITNEAVTAVITADPETGPVPLKTMLSALDSRDPDGEIVLYEWDMDNNGDFERRGEDLIEVEHNLNQIGDFIVRLRVTGRNNDHDTTEKKITVGQPEENLRAEITSKEPLEGFAPLNITLDASQSFARTGQIVRYEWFVEGEDKVVPGRKLPRTFRTPGEYHITLTIENDLGERTQATEIVKVLEQQGIVELNIRTTPAPDRDGILRGTAPFEVAFDASNSQIRNPVEWQWDFENDGIVDKPAQAVKYMFRKKGEFETKLTIIDASGRRFSKTQTVIVGATGTQARISADNPAGPVPLTVTFDGSASSTDDGEIIDYIWEFPGQDPVNYGAIITYEFDQVGVFPVKLNVLTSTGDLDQETFIVSVRSKPLKAEFTASPESGASPLEVSFDPSESTGTVVEYLWSFGDGQTSAEFRPTHTYTVPGEYTVGLKITDNKGVVANTSKIVTVIEVEDDSMNN